MKKIIGFFLLLNPLFLFSFVFIENKNPQAVVYICNENNYAQKLSASELITFIEKSTGVKIPTVMRYQKKKNVIIIGTKDDSEIKKILPEEDIKYLQEFFEYDCFIIKSFEKNNQNFLVFAGSNNRSCLYSIYHFLENKLNFGFYWEGDVIPKYKKISIENLKIYEKSFFPIRYYMQECDYGYSTRPWDINDWKKELLWMCKKKLNMIFIAEDWWNFIVKKEEIVDEAKKIGITCVFNIPLYRWASVDKKFVEENPNHKYVPASYRTSYYYIHPKDPLFIERGKEMIKKIVEKYGEGNFYAISPYGEARFPTLTKEELTELRRDFAESVINVIKSVDPDGKWIFWTWPFGFLSWDKKDVKIFLEQLPKDKVFICDSPEVIGDWHNKKYENFWGYNWVLSFIMLYGGDDHMKGNLYKAVKDIKNYVEQNTTNLKGIYLCPEIIHYNTIYFDMLSYLTWDPVNFDFERYVNNFVLRRYGNKSYEKMKKAWEILIKSVYSEVEGSEPLYERRIYPFGDGWMGIYITRVAQDIYNAINTKIPALEEVVSIFLDEFTTNRNNPCFVKDFVDVVRQYIAECFNVHICNLNRHFLLKDYKNFEKEKEKIKELLDILEEVLSSYPPYKISFWFERIKNLPDYKQYEEIIKTSMYTFANLDEGSLDYPTKDIYEVFKFYCKPRVLMYLEKLTENFGQEIKLQDLKEEYKKVEKEWLKLPLKECIEKENSRKDYDFPLDKIKKLIKTEVKTEKRELSEKENLLKFEEIPLYITWKEEFDEINDWKITYYKNGKILCNGGICTFYPPQPPDFKVVFGKEIPEINLRENPFLCFRFKQIMWSESDFSFEGLSKFVIWITWKDRNGKIYRNRIFQKEMVKYFDWNYVTLDLYSILSFISEPETMNKIEIEISYLPVIFDWIKIGQKK